MTQPFWFLLAVLAVWRVTHMFHAEDGPFDFLRRLRDWGGEGFVGRLLDCFYCLSLWIALPFAFWISEFGRELPLTWLALSGGAILMERLTSAFEAVHLRYTEEEPDDAVLR